MTNVTGQLSLLPINADINIIVYVLLFVYIYALIVLRVIYAQPRQLSKFLDNKIQSP